jgi:hypothetical protein
MVTAPRQAGPAGSASNVKVALSPSAMMASTPGRLAAKPSQERLRLSG